VAKAPLRETLAAALLLASGWDKVSPLIDPFCGSGTIPIEAALLALKIPPGINRLFAFMDWPDFDRSLWLNILDQGRKVGDAAPLIQASDRDAGAIKMAQANAERAGVLDYIEFRCQAISSIMPPPTTGWVVTNPPYGVRLEGNKDLRNLYARFGSILKDKCPGWNLAILCSEPLLLGQLDLALDTTLGFVNGGIRVMVGRGQVAL
jgi:putative N6-adenine-specific DNA methylase